MAIDRDLCLALAAHVEDGVVQEAVLQLVSVTALTPDPTVMDRSSERPPLVADLGGEDGNAFFLVCRAIHLLVKRGRIASACAVLSGYAQCSTYADLLAFVEQYVQLPPH